ncbi:MAG: redoxin domain-containing protein [Acetobacterium woodii]|nr:redoxin domain-containing protein [Acetobacterium woodii]
MTEMIQLGAMAPDFKLQDQNGETVTLSQFKGKKVLLSWHPLAWTSVCTDQMRSLDRNFDRFAEKNAVVLGFSVDPLPSKSVWAKALALKHLKVLSDFLPLGEVAKAYGIFSEEHGASKRANILINEAGMVIWAKKYEIRTLPDVEEVLGKM